MFAQEDAIFGIISPAAHKLRKDLLSPLFSRRNILGIEPLMQTKVYPLIQTSFGLCSLLKIDKLCKLLSENYDRGRASNLCFGYASMAVDIINEFCYGKCPEGLEALSGHTFESVLVTSTRCSINWTVWMYRNFGWIRGLVVNLPEKLANIITPSNTWTIIMMNVTCRAPHF